MMKKFENSSMKTVAKQSMSLQIPLGSVMEFARRSHQNVQRKRPELCCNHNRLLHHDNVPTHTSLKTTESVTNNNMVIILHPPYSPDLAPCHFALFPKLKMKLKGWRFETVSDIHRELHAVLKSIEQNDFHSTSEEWKK
jgi:histone-lysine N-methyltransferase SETMAR